MFTTTTPASPPTLSAATGTAVSPPTSPTRTSRLRGLSYLRNYTQNLHGRSESDSHTRGTRPAFPRARSQPSPDSVRNAGSEQQTPTSATAAAPPSRRAPSPPPTHSGNNNTTNGWVPSGNTSVGANRARIRQQSTADEAPSSGPAPTVTTAESTPARPMTRSRADTVGVVLAVRNQNGPRSSSADANDGTRHGGGNALPSIRFIPHYDPRANRPSLSFPAVTRTLPNENAVIKVGRYSERDNAPEIPANTPSSAPVGFKSKVVSRRHCEFWCQNSQWYVKDVKSSSGTFLNHVRLSPPGQESRAFAVNDGDVVQLGIDFRGGEEMIFRCVKIRIECNRGWQKHLNNFKYVCDSSHTCSGRNVLTSSHSKKTHKQLLARQKLKKDSSTRDSDTASVNSSECSVCLMSIAVSAFPTIQRSHRHLLTCPSDSPANPSSLPHVPTFGTINASGPS
jgi:pSer/pThr/pTyr-binding forkhead associated (FHA) protein